MRGGIERDNNEKEKLVKGRGGRERDNNEKKRWKREEGVKGGEGGC